MILTNSPREILVFENQLYHRFFGFLSILEAMLAPKTHPKSTQNRSKTYHKRGLTYDTFFNRFLVDFGRILGAKLGLCWGYVGYKTLSKATSKKIQKIAPKKGAGGSRREPEGGREASSWPLTTNTNHYPGQKNRTQKGIKSTLHS